MLGAPMSGEFADAHTVGKGLVHVFEQGVVVACHGQLSLMAEGHNTCRIAVRAGVAPCLQLIHHAAELLVCPGGYLAVVGAVALGVAPLALARGVVHEGDQVQGRLARQGEEKVLHPRIRHLAAQVQKVIRAQGACFAAGVQGLHCLAQHGYASLVVVFANRECVKDRGDAGRDYLGVVGEEGGLGLWPEHLGPWQEMLFSRLSVCSSTRPGTR